MPKKPWKPKLPPPEPGKEETPFQRFDWLVRKVIAVPKPEVPKDRPPPLNQ